MSTRLLPASDKGVMMSVRTPAMLVSSTFTG